MAHAPVTRQGRRTFLIGALTMIAAACTTGPGPGPGPLPGPVEPGPGPGPVPMQQRHLVAVIAPLSGKDAGIGQSLANAASLALTDSGNREIRLQSYDSAGAGGAAAATQRALADGAGLILGPLLADDVRAAAPVARGAGVPILAFSNDTSVAGGGVYVMGFTPAQSIDRVVTFARSKGHSRFGALVPSGVYGQRASQALLDAVNGSGGRVTAMETFARNAAGLRAAATRLKAKGPVDAVLIADSSSLASTVATMMPRGAKILGTELWASGALPANAAMKGAWFAAAPNAAFDQVARSYKARYGRSPYRLASLGYDGMLLATRATGKWRFGRPFPVATLTDRDGFAGVDGGFRFGRDGIAQRLLEVRQIGGGVVSPAPRGF